MLQINAHPVDEEDDADIFGPFFAVWIEDHVLRTEKGDILVEYSADRTWYTCDNGKLGGVGKPYKSLSFMPVIQPEE